MESVKKVKGTAALLLAIFLVAGCYTGERRFNALDADVAVKDGDGNPTEILITDLGSEYVPCSSGGDSKIIRVDLYGNITWQFDQGTGILGGAHNADVSPSGDEMLISDPCNNRVLVIDYPGDPVEGPEIIWDSSVACPEVTLYDPVDADYLGSRLGQGNLLITVRGSHRVLEFNPNTCETVWSFGVGGVPRSSIDSDDPVRLYLPHNGDKLPNGNVLICDSGLDFYGISRIIEVDPDTNDIVWSYKRLHDCSIGGVIGQACPGLGWARDSDVECSDPACDTGFLVLTGMHQTVGVTRDLNEAPKAGEDAPRGTEIVYQIEHDRGLCYDSDLIPQWADDTNEGEGFFLVSNHGVEHQGNWVQVVPVDVRYSFFGEAVWKLIGQR